MKLKSVVISLIALGVSSPLLAAGLYDVGAAAYQQAVMRDQANKMDLILDQNQPGGFDQPCGWACRINVSGWINTDAYLANRPPVFLKLNAADEVPPLLIPSGARASDLLINNANLFVDTRVNNWVKANTSLIYSSLTAIQGSQGVYAIPNSSFLYHPVQGNSIVIRSIDTAYATIGNSQVSPIYFRVGKEYVPFGQYDPYAFVQSENPTQLLTEINAPTAQLGFITPSGFYGSIYSFAGGAKLSDGGIIRRIQNGGADLGYQFEGVNSKYNIDLGYIANIADSNFLASHYANALLEVIDVAGLPNQKTPAYNINVNVNFGPFDANGHYVTTTRSLENYLAIDFLPVFDEPAAFLQKPKAWGLEAGFSFSVAEHQSRLAIGYQATRHLAGFLPKQRLYADWMVNLATWFDLGVAVFQDKDYSLTEGDILFAEDVLNAIGTGNKSTVGQLRASIKFA